MFIAGFVPANRFIERVSSRLPPASAESSRNSLLVKSLVLAMTMTPLLKNMD
jgi:hypothetical protein